MVSVPKDKPVTARTPAAPEKIRIAHISAFSGIKDIAGYNEFRYLSASPTVLAKIHGYELPLIIDSASEICGLSEEVACELNIWWKHADWKMITAGGNQSELSKMAYSMPVKVHAIVIAVHILLARSGSEQLNLGRPWETYSWLCKRNLGDGSCEMTILAGDGSEQVT
jgi:hypothetical protein